VSLRKKRIVTIYARGDSLILEFPTGAQVVKHLEAAVILHKLAELVEDEVKK